MFTDVLSEKGHVWVGLDMSKDMLDVGVQRGVEGDCMVSDMGQGFGFRPGSFDGIVSVSAIQWLCYSMQKTHHIGNRLMSFFTSLYRCLKRGGRAALQFYPENPEQLELITSTALRCGFGGGLVVDFPNSTKAKKYFLVLFSGVDTTQVSLPKGLAGSAQSGNIHIADRKRTAQGKDRTGGVKSKSWIRAKKDRQRKQGKDVRHDSKYTGRSRGDKF
jgi:18S rRNA (guanine1575-N7)-methyltransferase